MRQDDGLMRRYAIYSEPYSDYATCISCSLPIDTFKTHYKRGADIFCIQCAVDAGWLPSQNPNVKAVVDRQLANVTRKRRFR